MGGEISCEGPDAAVCCPGERGTLLPLFADEGEWGRGIRAVLYFVGLIWCFLGVGVVSDTFMSAIEVITSATRDKFVTFEGENAGENVRQKFRVDVWNPTVANLSLMALGSSAPEILLSVIELLTSKFFSGKLGPSTIVGSAAFNFLVITAVCVYAIPSTDTRKIDDLNVYLITGFFSVFAYLWLIIILLGSTPNRVDLTEGLITFFMFPFLVILAYLADTKRLTFFSEETAKVGVAPDNGDKVPALKSGGGLGDFMKKESQARVSVRGKDGDFASMVPSGGEVGMVRMSGTGGSMANMQMQKLAAYRQKVLAENPGATEDLIQKLVHLEIDGDTKKSRAHYRVKATRDFTGGKRVGPQVSTAERKSIMPTAGAKESARIGFVDAGYSVLECTPSVTLEVRCEGGIQGEIKVRYKTVDGPAKAGEDFEFKEGVLTFDAKTTQQSIEIKIIDDVQWELDEDFYVVLEVADAGQSNVEFGLSKTTVTIVNDDEPGELRFAQDEFTFSESGGVANLIICRKNGSSGEVGCYLTTINDTAIGGIDFKTIEKQKIMFKHQETIKHIPIEIIDDQAYEKNERFKVELTECFGGVKFDEKTDGGTDKCICDVIIESDDATKVATDHLANWLNLNFDKHRLGAGNYGQQFTEALYCNGGAEDQAAASKAEWAMHILSVFWKVLFAFIPPTDYCGGWLCFVCALGMIGVVTAIVGDLASLLGCVIGLPDEITAITLVALGTSLPDTFASKTAAEQDPYADASVGNVTGSNAVNVMLGLGIPWTMGAIYWDTAGITPEWLRKTAPGGESYEDVMLPVYEDGAFIVPAGALAFSVMVYCSCAAVNFVILLWRRKTTGGELGGKGNGATAVAQVGLWAIYIALSSWKVISDQADSA